MRVLDGFEWSRANACSNYIYPQFMGKPVMRWWVEAYYNSWKRSGIAYAYMGWTMISIFTLAAVDLSSLVITGMVVATYM